ncbi:MAG: peptidoglycan DD-metalloendopeptidase family protein [Bauldia sp.]|nr:peptidoglycan DD-metalloendopeptidase family protein [Bauldia sp.]
MTRRFLLGLGLAALAALANPLAAAAQDDAAALLEERRAALDGLLAEITVSAERQAELEAEIAAIETDRATLNETLIATNQRTQELETAIAASEARIAGLVEDEAAIRTSLAGRREVLGEVLAALQRMGRQPPPAILIQPEDALASVRSAILLGAVVPELRAEAAALVADMEALMALRAEQEAEQSRLLADAATLAEESQRIELLLAERQTASDETAAELEEQRARAAALAADAGTLEELIGAFEPRNVAAFAPESEPAVDVTPIFLGEADRIRPAIPFASARGLLPRPAAGELLIDFGGNDGFGGRAAGISLGTRSGARVSSPSDGWVEFAGPYRSYGNLLIVNAGDGYLVLLAGMDQLDVRPGQFVLAGEPVGMMGTARVADAGGASLGNVQPVLYVEFRRAGTPINPGPWWAQPF